jgi:hypothetical protein
MAPAGGDVAQQPLAAGGGIGAVEHEACAASPDVGRRGSARGYVDSAENESHGSSLGGKLRRFCNGTRFRYLFF